MVGDIEQAQGGRGGGRVTVDLTEVGVLAVLALLMVLTVPTCNAVLSTKVTEPVLPAKNR